MSPREVQLTNPDRVIFPDVGVTKGDLAAYYEDVAPAILPHLRNRPFTMKRYRGGATDTPFFQKQAPQGMPSWIPTRRFQTHPREGGTRLVDFPLVNSPEALVWMVQMHCIDMNAWYSRIDKPHRPDYVVLDLDPPDGGFKRAVQVAHLLRELLDEVGLPGYVKTSGADGIHVLAPIARRSTFEQTYDFAGEAARLLEARHPELVTTQWLKRKRPADAVLLDHRQNGWGKTIATVYSVRPKPGAPVSTPLRWDELDESIEPQQFTMGVARERIAQHGDLFAAVLDEPRPLGAAAKRLAHM